jgi:Tn3 transposase DDE domain
MCRIAVSINTGEVSAHDVTRMISRDGRPTALGEAVAHYVVGLVPVAPFGLCEDRCHQRHRLILLAAQVRQERQAEA